MLIVNRLRVQMVKNQDSLGVEDVQDVLGNGVKLLGIVPEDEAIITSTNRGEPVSLGEGTLAGQAYRNIARRLRGEDVPFLDLDVKVGFIERLKRMFAAKSK